MEIRVFVPASEAGCLVMECPLPWRLPSLLGDINEQRCTFQLHVCPSSAGFSTGGVMPGLFLRNLSSLYFLGGNGVKYIARLFVQRTLIVYVLV